jgi:PIN domain nuclease of toxin-antitoxin system
LRVLVDTHAFVWWVIDSPRLSARARELFTSEDNEICVSAVVAWELATKVRLGKWAEASPIATNVERVVADNDFSPLPVSIEHARIAGFFAGRHRDPFDRMLAAQAQVEGIPLVSVDPVFRTFGTFLLW